MSDNQQHKWCEAYYGQLVGATILEIEVTTEDDDELYGMVPQVWTKIHCRAADGERFTLEISSDEEGNEPGFLFGLPVVSV